MTTRVARTPVVGSEDFRTTLARHAAGVVVVTGPGPVGLTATSFTSVSLDPPLVSFCVDRSSTTWPDLRAAPAFAVNVLDAGQAAIAAGFARRGADRFAAVRWRTGPHGVPIIRGVGAHVVCEPYDTIAAGDHWLVLGIVIGTGVADAAEPLLYHRGRFGRFTPHAA